MRVALVQIANAMLYNSDRLHDEADDLPLAFVIARSDICMLVAHFSITLAMMNDTYRLHDEADDLPLAFSSEECHLHTYSLLDHACLYKQ